MPCTEAYKEHMQHLHTEYERELVPLFVKVLGIAGQGANWKMILLIVARSSPTSWALNFISSFTCFLLRALR